jgi:hypothetical protein
MLGEHGLHGSPLELIAALDKVVGYTRRYRAHTALGCAGLLHALISTFTEPVNPVARAGTKANFTIVFHETAPVSPGFDHRRDSRYRDFLATPA